LIYHESINVEDGLKGAGSAMSHIPKGTRYKGTILVSALLLLGFFIIYYFFLSSSRIFVSTLKLKFTSNGNTYIQVISEDDKEVTIRTPEIVWPLLIEGKEYFIKYRYSLVRKPYLVRIEESEQ
jgi:hypothetical protein